jgi:hypothetical protein
MPTTTPPAPASGPPQPFAPAPAADVGASNSHNTSTESLHEQKSVKIEKTKLRKFLDIINWKPKRTRWNPDKPPVFSMWMNVLFGFAGAFTVADL